MTQERIKEVIQESLRDWFKKEKWVRISSSGKIAGPCGTSKNKKNPDRCLPKAKAQSLSKGERAATAAKKKRAGKKGKTVVSNTKKAKVKRETKEAPAGHYFTASGNLVKGRMSKDAKERGARKSDPKDKMRSKVPKATQYAEITKEDIHNLVVGLLNETNEQWHNFKKNRVSLKEPEIEKMINLRDKARENKDYKEADRIRDELSDKGVLIEDKDGKTLWKFK